MADDVTPPDASPSLATVLAQIRESLGFTDAAGMAGLTLESLERHTRHQLLDWAHRLGLTDLQRLTKESLATRVRDALARFGIVPGEPAGERSGPTLPQKFDLGLPPGKQGLPEHIPWGYGHDRVTAMVVDPDRLYVYWEVTDAALARARADLGAGGADAWVNLRVYDVTGRIFDGTNAHRYFDHALARDDRQWFFTIGKPTSTAVVEVGMRSREGYFVRIARSGRAEFPRREPVPAGPVDWLTVRTASGPVEPPVTGGPPPAGAPAGGVMAPPATPAIDGEGGEGMVRAERFVPGETLAQHWDWEQWFRSQWTDAGRHLEWRSPMLCTTWEAGPFAYPVESPAYVEERHEGTAKVYMRNGHTHVVYGPWQVVIRGFGAHAERRIVATWEMVCSWMAEPAVESTGHATRLPAGAPAHLGSSELHLFGASETLYAGASEWLHAGASERRRSPAR